MIRNLKALGLLLVALLAMSALGGAVAQAAEDPADFAASEYPATVTTEADPNAPTQTFTTATGNITCQEVRGDATLAAQSNELTGTGVAETGPEFTNCHATALKFPTTVDTNGCHFTFTAGTALTEPEGTFVDSTGSVRIHECDSATGVIVRIYGGAEHTEANLGCQIDVHEQELNGITYKNVETEGVEEVTAEVNVQNQISAQFTPGPKGLCKEETHTGGSYTGKLTAHAENELGELINFTVTPTP
jgi:hypothetical protein